MTYLFFKEKNYFQGFFLPDDHSWAYTLLNKNNHKFQYTKVYITGFLTTLNQKILTPQINDTPFLHAYNKIFSQLFIDDSTNLISLYS